MARLGIQEEEKLLVLKYDSGLSPYIAGGNLSIKMEKEDDPIETWVKFVEYVWKEFYLPKYLEQQYKKWQQLRQWKDQFVQSYTNEFYRLMDRLGAQEEEKFLVLNYVSGLSPYIQQEM